MIIQYCAFTWRGAALSMISVCLKCVNLKLDPKQVNIAVKFAGQGHKRIDFESLPTSIHITNLIWVRKLPFVLKEKQLPKYCLKATLYINYWMIHFYK